MLSDQIQIISCDTGIFYSKHEERLHLQNHKLRNERKQLLNGYVKKTKSGKKRIIRGLKDIESDLSKFGLTISDLENIKIVWCGKLAFVADCEKLIQIIKNKCDYVDEEQGYEIYLDVSCLWGEYNQIKKQIEHKREKIKETKAALLQLLENKTNENIKTNGKHHIRELRENKVSRKNIISVFDSILTRMIGAEIDKLSEDFMVVQVYYFQILHDIIDFGFEYNGERYIYFTSSAGQIRTKKAVFIKESVWNKFEKTIMCGLTVEEINRKGGVNRNKYLAYLALANSATDEWEEFDIDRTIVVDDFETEVCGEVDYIDDKDFSIERKIMDIPITHTDGCGMMLPNTFGKKQINMMVRLPWIKGLLGVFDFRKFIEHHNASPIIKDIYGIEHDVVAEDIQVIFTKSQFKMAKYFQSWDEYKENFKKYNCHAGTTNPEEERIKNATINYQMLQSLVDITDDEILKIANSSIDTVKNIASSIETVKDVLGVSPYNLNKTYFQKSVSIYPEILNDVFIKNKLREVKESLVKQFKAGKLKVNGKYTFILPDLYAACEYWFLNNSNPQGLLENGEVFCWLYRKADRLDCLRSPHLFMEHSIRKNIACISCNNRQKQIREWFVTNALYTSTYDLISKVLQFDVDGDRSLVVADKTLIDIAQRNIDKYHIVPLYYNMKKAQPSIISREILYEGLVLAFTSAPIGLHSNNISKIWGSDICESGTYEEQLHALDCIKRLTAYSNFTIDFAKTLYKPEFFKEIKKDIQEFTKQKLPHYFVYAKDKQEDQVRHVNGTFVNKLCGFIPNPRLRYTYMNPEGKQKALGKPNYRLLMSNPDLEIKVFTKSGRLIEKNAEDEYTNPIVWRYNELASKYGFKINAVDEDISLQYIPREMLYKSQTKQVTIYGQILHEVKDELSQFGYTDEEVADILVKYLYDIKDSKNKDLLWACYGEILYKNLKDRVKSPTKEVQCVDCDEWFEINKKDTETCRCQKCYHEYRRQYKAQKEKERRLKIKKMSSVDSATNK